MSIFFDEHWETTIVRDGTNSTGWVHTSNGYPTGFATQTAVVFPDDGETKSMQEPYVGLTGNDVGKGGPSLFKSYTATAHLFGRTYFRTTGMTFSDPSRDGSKIFYVEDNNNTVIYFFAERNGVFGIDFQFTWDENTQPTTLYPGTPIPLNQWNLLEFEILFNTPGSSNGYCKLYQNGALTAQTLNRAFLGPTPGSLSPVNGRAVPSTAMFREIKFFLQDWGGSVGSHYYDRTAVGDTAPGPVGGPPTNLPPAAPTGVTIT